MVREIICYVASVALIVICYIAGNLVVSILWGLNIGYDSWMGVIQALLSTGMGIGLYFTAATKVKMFENRHITVPPLVLGLCGLTATTLLAYLTQALGYPLAIPPLFSSVVSLLGWAGFGFWALTQPIK